MKHRCAFQSWRETKKKSSGIIPTTEINERLRKQKKYYATMKERNHRDLLKAAETNKQT